MSDENLFAQLRKDHEMQRDVLDMLTDTSGASEGREKMLKVLSDLLTSHAKYEEMYLYGPMMEIESTVDLARHSVAEHKEIDDTLNELKEKKMTSPGWLVTAEKLQELVLHHLDEEEREVFRPAGKFLDNDDKLELARKYKEAMQEHRNVTV